MAIEGLIHFYLICKYLEYATHLGLMFLTNFLGSVLTQVSQNHIVSPCREFSLSVVQ